MSAPIRTPAGPSLDSAPEPAAGTSGLRGNPVLHRGPGRVYNPLTDRTLADGEPGFSALWSVLAGARTPAQLPAAERDALCAAGWLVPIDEDVSTRFLLKYVSLEASTVCNQGCYFCPVSIARRDKYMMPTELYEDIVRQISAYRETIHAVFMINYNEPTADPRFVDQVGMLRAAGLPPATLTNGTGLTPKRVDALLELGGLRYLSINLSTLNRERYAADRGGDHLPLVLRNLDYVKDLPVGEEMEIVVLGTGDETHQQDVREIERYYEGSRFTVKSYEVMDRAGYLPVGLKPDSPKERLCGCENVGSRPFQHLHITPEGKCVLCCEDYDEYHVVGDLTEETVDEVLTGPRLALMRRWVYGLEEAPDNFICRNCVFALDR